MTRLELLFSGVRHDVRLSRELKGMHMRTWGKNFSSVPLCLIGNWHDYCSICPLNGRPRKLLGLNFDWSAVAFFRYLARSRNARSSNVILYCAILAVYLFGAVRSRFSILTNTGSCFRRSWASSFAVCLFKLLVIVTHWRLGNVIWNFKDGFKLTISWLQVCYTSGAWCSYQIQASSLSPPSSMILWAVFNISDLALYVRLTQLPLVSSSQWQQLKMKLDSIACQLNGMQGKRALDCNNNILEKIRIALYKDVQN